MTRDQLKALAEAMMSEGGPSKDRAIECMLIAFDLGRGSELVRVEPNTFCGGCCEDDHK